MTDPALTIAVAGVVGALAVVVRRVGEAMARRYELDTTARHEDRIAARAERERERAELERLRAENAELRADLARLMPDDQNSES